MKNPWLFILPLLVAFAVIAGSVSLLHRSSLPSSVATSSEAVSSVPPIGSSTSAKPSPASSSSTVVTSSPSGTGTVTGSVLLGPTCPVERIPPDPQCADKPYQTSIHIYQGASASLYKTIQSDANGAFSVKLAAGTYSFAPVGGNGVPPTCRFRASVIVTAGQSQKISLECDSGIR